MRKKLTENDLVLKWPTPFRDGIKFTNHDLGDLDIIIQGNTEVTVKDLEQMKNFGYAFDGFCTPPDEPSSFPFTIITFRRYQAPPLENGGKSDRHVLSLRGKFE